MFRHIIDILTPQRVKDARAVSRANRVLHLVPTERQQHRTHHQHKDAA